MATGPGVPGAMNVFIPNWEASGQLAVGFSRNPRRFKLARYVKYVRSPKNRGYYLKHTNQVQGRIIDQNRYAWPFGKPRPVPADPEKFNWLEFNLKRWDYPYGLDNETVRQADFKPMEVERRNKATLCMAARTKRSATALTTTTNWTASTDGDLAADHTASATTLAGAKLDTGTSANPILMIGLNAAQKQIALDTMGVVEFNPADFMLIMNPTDASNIATSPEFKDYLKSSPAAFAQVTGRLHENSRYGLPPELYGVSIVIEDAVEVTSERDDTLARSFIWPNGSVLLAAKQGSLEGVYGEQDFSTYTIFYGGAPAENSPGEVNGEVGMDMVVTEFQDYRNDMHEGHVTEKTIEVVTCPASGYLITAATG